jgi:hypothetical protein
MIRSLRFLLLAALVSTPLAAVGQATELVVIDLRPDEEKSGHALMPLAGKCNKDVFRIADVASDPTKLAALTEHLRTALGETAAGKTLTVLNWSIYYNKQVRKSGGMFENIGIQGYSVPGKKKERKAGSICPKQESAGGWYEGDELESVYFPLISEFEGTLAGRLVRARVVHSPRQKLTGEFTGAEDDTEQLLETVRETADAVATELLK